MWASKEGGSGPGDKRHGGERGHSCLFFEDRPPPPCPSSSWALSCGLNIYYCFPPLLKQHLTALWPWLSAVFMISSGCWGVHLPKLFCYWRCACSFCQTNSWALITKMWADCREASRDGLDPTGGTEGISWPSLGLKRREETGTWGESWV